MIEGIVGLAKAIEDEVIGFRRDLHRIPGIAHHNGDSAEYIIAKLKEFGIENIRTGLSVSGFGVTADIVGTKPGGTGKMIALRADMDALPVTEQTGCEYASTRPGTMHACGHDGHMAMLLGAAKILQEHKAELAGTVRLIFQADEEIPPPSGSQGMIDCGVLEGVDAIYMIHMQPEEPTGTIAFNKGMAGSALDCFKIYLKGKGGHGSKPHQCIDAITLSAQVVNNIQYIVSRQVDPLEPVVLTLGTIEGGTLWNVIAGEVKITGTMRSYNEEVRAKALADLERTIKHTCLAVGADYKFENEPAVDVLTNHYSAADFLESTLVDTIGEEHVKVMRRPSTVTEDSAKYLARVPGCFMWLGCSSSEETSYALHHPKFQMDEAALKTGVAAHVAVANRFLNTDVELKYDIG